MVAAGAHPKYLQAQMGHSSIHVTLDLYGHLFPDANRGVLESLDALTAPSASGDFQSGSDGLEPATSGVTGLTRRWRAASSNR